jgi:NADPH:quinone reductase-like Zn-dependent oxidoreductase
MTSQESSEGAGTRTMDRMRAIVRETYGGPEVLRLARVPRPVTKGDDVLVRVRAAGVDRGVWHIMTGLPYLARVAFGLRKPRGAVLGLDLAGTVEAVGPEVTRFAVGDAVYGSGRGSYAEYALASEAKLAPKPQALSFEQAAVVPVSAVTALQGLRAGKIQEGQKVLVTGAGGGVGSYAVQLAKAYGAQVTGVCSTEKVEFVRSLGADHVIDYTREDFTAAGPFDLILDIAGNPSISRLRRALTPAGTAVITGGEDGGKLTGGLHRQLSALALSPFIRQRLTMFLGLVRAADLQDLAPFLEAGTIVPALHRSFTLAEAKDAIRFLESGRVRGKVVLTI